MVERRSRRFVAAALLGVVAAGAVWLPLAEAMSPDPYAPLASASDATRTTAADGERNDPTGTSRIELAAKRVLRWRVVDEEGAIQRQAMVVVAGTSIEADQQGRGVHELPVDSVRVDVAAHCEGFVPWASCVLATHDLEIVLQRPRYTVRVIDEADRPVAGATVALAKDSRVSVAELRARLHPAALFVTTGPDGVARFGAVPPAAYLIHVEHPQLVYTWLLQADDVHGRRPIVATLGTETTVRLAMPYVVAYEVAKGPVLHTAVVGTASVFGAPTNVEAVEHLQRLETELKQDFPRATFHLLVRQLESGARPSARARATYGVQIHVDKHKIATESIEPVRLDEFIAPVLVGRFLEPDDAFGTIRVRVLDAAGADIEGLLVTVEGIDRRTRFLRRAKSNQGVAVPVGKYRVLFYEPLFHALLGRRPAIEVGRGEDEEVVVRCPYPLQRVRFVADSKGAGGLEYRHTLSGLSVKLSIASPNGRECFVPEGEIVSTIRLVAEDPTKVLVATVTSIVSPTSPRTIEHPLVEVDRKPETRRRR